MATSEGTTTLSGNSDDCHEFKYRRQPWGEILEGTKSDLQSFGIGVGMVFPCEPGAPKRKITVRDPRGFVCTVYKGRYLGDRDFEAWIPIPGRERTKENPQFEYAPGVTICQYFWGEEYVGTADALAAAGLVRTEHLPGQPGMRKVVVTILPDGTIPIGPPTCNHPEANLPGGKQIRRKSKTMYSVTVKIATDEKERRLKASQLIQQEYMERMRALPYPPPLRRQISKQNELAVIERRKNIRLVWSLPNAADVWSLPCLN